MIGVGQEMAELLDSVVEVLRPPAQHKPKLATIVIELLKQPL